MDIQIKDQMSIQTLNEMPQMQNSIMKNSNILYSINLNSNLKLMGKPETAFNELQIKYDKKNKDDVQQLKFILSTLLTYPSSAIAQLHRDANRLGKMDHIKNFNQKIQHVKKSLSQINNKDQFCPCCGFMKQTQTLSLCTNFEKVNHIGIATYLFFTTLQHIIFLLTVMFFVYCIYDIVTNIISSNIYRENAKTGQIIKKNQSYYGFLVISLGSKQVHETVEDKIFYNIQCWIGTGLVAIWGFLFAFIKYQERIRSLEIGRKTKKASDFTIFIKNFPKNMQIEQFERQLNQFYEKRAKIDDIFKIDEKVKVVKINKAIPFYFDKQSFDCYQLKQINKNYNEYKKQFARWIQERKTSDQFTLSLQQRKSKIQYFFLLKKKRIELYNQNAEKIKKYFMERKNQDNLTVPAFVTFNNNMTKQSLAFIHQDSHSLFNFFLSKQIKKERYFHFKNIGSHKLVMAEISKAPEPEDIIWTNLGRTRCKAFQNKFITYSVTIVILGISFGAVYGLSKIQADYTERNQGASIQYLSIFISLVISTLNVIIQQILRYVTKLQKSTTNTEYQISMAIKAIVALILNSIAIPIFVNYFLQSNLYGVNGLAYDVFYLGITNSFLSPLIRIFDIEYFFFRLVKWYQNRPSQKLLSNQQKLNFYTQHIEFQLGYEHIYIVNLFLFTCFFCSLQPIIIIFAITGLSIMYWAQKNALFNRSRRPVPSNNFVNTAMYQLIFLGPLFFSIGSFCWSHFFKTQFIGIAPNLTSTILSLIIFLIPYKKIIKILNKKKERYERNFQQERVFFSCEYDRANPATSHKAVLDYVQILQKKRNSIVKKSSSQIMNFEKQLIKNNARNNLIKHSLGSDLRNIDQIDSESDGQNILRKSFAVNYVAQSNIRAKVSDKRYRQLRSSMPNALKTQSYQVDNHNQSKKIKKGLQNQQKAIKQTIANIAEVKPRTQSQEINNYRIGIHPPHEEFQSNLQSSGKQLKSESRNSQNLDPNINTNSFDQQPQQKQHLSRQRYYQKRNVFM